MPRPEPGPQALVWYIQTGDRDARISYRELPEQERLEYRDTVNRVYAAAIAHHFGEHPSRDQVDDLIERVRDRHPQYGGGVKLVLTALVERGRRAAISPRQILTAQHLVIREIAKLHPGFRSRADRVVLKAATSANMVGAQVNPTIDAEFEGVDPDAIVSVKLGLDGSLRSLELLRGVERMGGRSIATRLVQAWVAAEKQRWARAKALGVPDSAPEPGTGTGRGDAFVAEAYSSSKLCRARVDRYGRLRAFTFMRAGLFGDDGRLGLAAEIREAIDEAQAALKAEL
jgi:hypothetical protein